MGRLELAITTVGDLLLNQNITRDKNGHSWDVDHPGGVCLHIPQYQRPYKWTVRNATQLFDDIVEARNAKKEVYRLGTLILHREQMPDGSTVYNIVDGQQRAITLALLLYVLFEKDDARTDIEFLKQNLFVNESSCHNIPTNLNAFRRKIHRQTDDESFNVGHKLNMQRLRDYLINRCELIIVVTDDASEAFQFFDSQNARGKALYPHDLLKAYHLREMDDVDESTTEKTVKDWERIPQYELASFFGDYIYRLKEWLNGNYATRLDEQNIHKFKGLGRNARTPYAQFFKSAYSYANLVNTSAMPFVSGGREIKPFQLNTPIIAGQPFFDYTQHYYALLSDIRDNNPYEGFYIQNNPIVRTLDKYYAYGTGNRITRLMFDTALLLYVDRFCPAVFPSKDEVELFEQFVVYAFVWAYSLRFQYDHLGWQSAQNYILGQAFRKIKNSINIYSLIAQSDTPMSLMSTLADKLVPLSTKDSGTQDKSEKRAFKVDAIDLADSEGVYKHYMHFFKSNNFF